MASPGLNEAFADIYSVFDEVFVLISRQVMGEDPCVCRLCSVLG